VSRGRLVAWTSLVVALSALNYYGRFSGSQSATRAARNAVYSYSAFGGGLLIYAIWLGVVVWIAYGRFDLLALRAPRTGTAGAAKLTLAAVAVVYLVEALVAILPLPESPGKEQGLAPSHWESAHAGAFAANVVLFAVVAPFVEELTFRGLGQSLLQFLGRWPSILIVGVSFGLAHGLLEALLVLVPFGIVLAWLRDRTDSVYPGMVVHGVFNGLALAAAVLT
jgi:membrane protease YdiL (CAAX protease family)